MLFVQRELLIGLNFIERNDLQKVNTSEINWYFSSNYWVNSKKSQFKLALFGDNKDIVMSF